MRQMRSAFDFLSLSNNLAAAVSGLDRVEKHDYPEIAVREAISMRLFTVITDFPAVL